MATRLAARWITMAEKPTLYITGRKTTPYQWSVELASTVLGRPNAQIEGMVGTRDDSRCVVLEALKQLPCTSAFGKFNRSSVEEDLDAYRYIYDADPWCIVLDRLAVNERTLGSIVHHVETVAPYYMLIQ